MLHRIVFIALAVLIAGCSDPKAANEKNFAMAIQKTLDAEYPRCYVEAKFPATIEGFDMNNHKAVFPALVKAGLLSEKEESREVTDWMGGKKELVVRVYDLTETGKQFYKADGENNGFCFGKATVKEITEFTEPSDAQGVRASQVKFTYIVSDFPSWAKSPEMLAANTSLKEDVESEKTPINSLDVLALTNNGWVSQLGGMRRMLGR